MSFLDRVVRGAGLEARAATLANPPEWLVTALGGGATKAGQMVNVKTALGLVPVYSAVTLVAGAAGSLPLIVYRRLATGGKERAESHRAWSLLHDQPNPQMAADEVWEIVFANLNLWGNAFIWKQRDTLGNVGAMWPLRPNRLQVTWDPDGNRTFIVDGTPGYTESDILHVRGLSQDGLVGYSPIQLAKESLGVMLAQQEFAGEFFKGDGRPAVILRHPNKLGDDAAKRLKASWDSVKAGGTAVLEEAIEVEPWTMPLNDAQFVEQEKLSDLRIAQLFHIPPSKLGAPTGDSMTYSTTEMQGIDFVTYTLRRWLTRLEGSLRRDPSIFLQGQRFFAEFLVDALLRADTKSRYQAYMLGITKGFLTVDEVREMENLPPLDQPALAPNGQGAN